MTPRQTRERVSSATPTNPVLLLDCRRVEEHAFCRIEGATLVPMDQTVARADEIEEAAGGRDREIIVYCHHGRRSMQVTATLRGLGFTRVRSMAGGIDLWSVDIDAGVPRYSLPKKQSGPAQRPARGM
ncbi:MAG: rhodanese-like domain-containing protein [Phycisphaerales bacterium]